MEVVSGFSQMSKEQKLQWLGQQLQSQQSTAVLKQFWLNNPNLQSKLDEFSENTLSNYILPFGIAPNFLINEKNYCLPMVIEESSVVAAAANAAKFWATRGGFKTEVINVEKTGQVHFFYTGDEGFLHQFFNQYKTQILSELSPLLKNMEARGGGILNFELLNCQTEQIKNYYQLALSFNTCDAMGANFINTILEELSKFFRSHLYAYAESVHEQAQLAHFEIIMSILSNYTPNCLVKVWVECHLNELSSIDGMAAGDFVRRFIAATEIAQNDISRAVTHNKGIMNGVDALVIATGNDYRAVEACIHAYACSKGKYAGLSQARLGEDGKFRFEMTIPLSLGTVGGLTNLHPLAKFSLELLGMPNAEQLMEIVAVAGLAQNFSALRSLVTSGIQKGHMKMHLLNILQQLGARPQQIEEAKIFFSDKVVSFSSVREFIEDNKSSQELSW